MKKINSSSPIANTYYMCIVAAMTYDKQARRIAGHDYVREVTRWPGHVRVLNIPVEYTLEIKYTLSKCVYLYQRMVSLIDTSIENKTLESVLP